MLLTESGLQWPTLPTSPPDGTDPDTWAQAVAMAVEHLWTWTARTYGTRDVTYRPASLIECGPVLSVAALMAAWGWAWALNPALTPLWGDQRAGGELPGVLHLPGPAVSVAEVRIDGAVLPASAYRLDGDYLVRIDGTAWPQQQNLISTDGTVGTWHVQYQRGVVVPVGGQVAAGQLALEWLKALSGGKSCLPWNVTTVSRAGVTINRDASKLARLTNVEAADRWVERVNPAGLVQQPTVWSPDLPRGGRPYYGSTGPLAAH